MTFSIAALGDALRAELGLEKYKKINAPGAICFEKQNSETSVELIFSYYHMVDGYSFRTGVSGRKSFSEIENILAKYYKKYHISRDLGTIHKSSAKINFESPFFDYQITSEVTLKEVKPMLMEWVYGDVLPFLDRYQNIEDVYREMESMPLLERNYFIRDPMPVRSLIMKGLLKTDDFLEYGDFLEKVFSENKDKPYYKYEIKYFNELYQELKNIQ
ncbi:hypothetical protein PVT68_11690 [Microbulbifer bruguierae]|uniref:Uncharacterized protein n=1 Tax=Microbulbifer bruguierae TaxID=3029061 RepID=A0ABY8N9V0_9GAMM|nr:hypothetical protein [Microbulbifer bruguierae]WGL15430.1 hypothetical protein PVT68_11690 [Microbulbifer bruguierae]